MGDLDGEAEVGSNMDCASVVLYCLFAAAGFLIGWVVYGIVNK